MSEDYEIVPGAPDAQTYAELRAAGGLSAFPPDAIASGLHGSWHAVRLVWEAEIVGMGRIVGDGGCFFQIVDIVVHPDHQKKGLGKAIMQALMDELEVRAPVGAYVSLIADIPADKLYSQFGFHPTAPRSIAMARRF